MLEELKAQVCKANLDLVREGLVIQTFGNASGIDRASGNIVINITGSKADAAPIAAAVEPVVQRVLRGTGAPVMDFGG